MSEVTKLEADQTLDVHKVVLLKELVRADRESDTGTDVIVLSKVGKIFDADCTPSFASQMFKITQTAVRHIMDHANSVAIMCKDAETGEILRIPGSFTSEVDLTGSNRPAIVADFTFKNLPLVEPSGYFVVLDEDGYLLVSKEVILSPGNDSMNIKYEIR